MTLPNLPLATSRSPLTFGRRRFLAAGAALTLSAGLGRRLAQAAGENPTADLLLPGKDRRLIVYKADNFEIETPLDLLRAQPVTPVEALFVRNNQQPAWSKTLEPRSLEGWNIEIVGRLEYPRAPSLVEIAALPQIEHEMVLQCSGNGRTFFSQASPVKGSPWAHGAAANVRFRGVPLAAVFDKFDVRPHASAKFLTAEGIEVPGKPTDADFEHSLPLKETLARSFLAFEMNGKPLPAVHGGPVRLITPGYYGTMNVKWLSRLRLEEQETVNHHQVKRYRTPLAPIEPGSEFEYGLENSEPNWDMKIKSLWFTPLEGEKLKAGRAVLGGVAWNDGRARIDAVEVSNDGGRRWQRAELDRPAGRYAWHSFQIETTLEPGKQTWLCRAVDTLGRTQPLDGSIGWNPAGYGWNGVHAVSIVVE